MAALPSVLQFAPWQSNVGTQFWERLASLKLDEYQLSEDARQLTGWQRQQCCSKSVVLTIQVILYISQTEALLQFFQTEFEESLALYCPGECSC